MAWQKSIELSKAIYMLTSTFPVSEQYSISQQVHRASVSVSSNLAEGFGRQTRKEFRHFVGIARGSNCEVESLLATARALGFGDPKLLADAEAISRDVSRLVNGLFVALGKA